jgi:hypothetical protein
MRYYRNRYQIIFNRVINLLITEKENEFYLQRKVIIVMRVLEIWFQT